MKYRAEEKPVTGAGGTDKAKVLIKSIFDDLMVACPKPGKTIDEKPKTEFLEAHQGGVVSSLVSEVAKGKVGIAEVVSKAAGKIFLEPAPAP